MSAEKEKDEKDDKDEDEEDKMEDDNVDSVTDSPAKQSHKIKRRTADLDILDEVDIVEKHSAPAV